MPCEGSVTVLFSYRSARHFGNFALSEPKALDRGLVLPSAYVADKLFSCSLDLAEMEQFWLDTEQGP